MGSALDHPLETNHSGTCANSTAQQIQAGGVAGGRARHQGVLQGAPATAGGHCIGSCQGISGSNGLSTLLGLTKECGCGSRITLWSSALTGSLVTYCCKKRTSLYAEARGETLSDIFFIYDPTRILVRQVLGGIPPDSNGR